jgi:hypothetical protein
MDVSTIGNPRARSGASTATAVELFIDPRTARAARANPTNSEPESPRKTLAVPKL